MMPDVLFGCLADEKPHGLERSSFGVEKRQLVAPTPGRPQKGTSR